MATANLYDVLRPVPGTEGLIPNGQTVDVSGWPPRRVSQLVERRYLRPAEAPAVMVAPPAPPTPPDPPARPAKPSGKE